MKYIYGPVRSRRLGISLGLTLTAAKICNFNCVYCQLGRTVLKAGQRKEHIKTEEIVNELKSWLGNSGEEAKGLNYITLSGSGEPTLNISIGELIQEIKKITNIPVAVITNASLLGDPAVRRTLIGANLIVPSLDAVDSSVFKEINRPQQEVRLEDIIDGLIKLRREFSGKIWLEVMLVKGINDDLRQIKKLKEVIERINPDKVQLNSPVRSTAEPNVLAVEKSKLKKIQDILGDRCEIL